MKCGAGFYLGSVPTCEERGEAEVARYVLVLHSGVYKWRCVRGTNTKAEFDHRIQRRLIYDMWVIWWAEVELPGSHIFLVALNVVVLRPGPIGLGAEVTH